MMKSLTPFLIGFLISGFEPFWPLGSPVIAIAAVLGVKNPNSKGLVIAVTGGLIRDVLLVNKLGISSAIAGFAWIIAAAAATRLGRPQAISLAAAAIAAVPASFFPGPASYQYILATALLAGVFSTVWNFISERDETIKIRR